MFWGGARMLFHFGRDRDNGGIMKAIVVLIGIASTYYHIYGWVKTKVKKTPKLFHLELRVGAKCRQHRVRIPCMPHPRMAHPLDQGGCLRPWVPTVGTTVPTVPAQSPQ